MTRPFLMTIVVAAFMAVPKPAAAQRVDLTITPSVISFPSSDPDTVPLVSAAPVEIRYRVRQNRLRAWQLTVLASGDLISGSSTVDISNVTWVAAPAPPFRNGTLSRTVAQTVANGFGNVNPARTGTITFRVVNAWTYAAGTYTQTLVFTLSAP